MTNQEIVNEMIIYTPLNTHQSPNTILNMSSNVDIDASQFAYFNTTLVTASSTDEVDAASANIAIVDEINDIAKLSLVVGEDGIVVIPVGDFYENVEANRSLMNELVKEFKIVQPAIFKDNQSFLFASKKYHPTADMILQRAEMMTPVSYYNADTHKAVFVYDNLIENLYKGAIYR